MGTLTLPTSGAVYVNANAIIYRVEQIEPYLTLTKPLWDALDASTQDVITSELSMLEVLVKPFRLNDAVLATLFIDTLYGTPGFTCHAIITSVRDKRLTFRLHYGC